MLVSHKHKFIYIKSIKTAGTSTEIFLEPYCVTNVLESHGREMIQTNEGIIGTRMNQHLAEISEFYNHMPPYKIKNSIGEETFNSYTKIINIRNPFDMMVSHYYFKPTFDLYSNSEMSFEDYLLKTNVVEDLSKKYRDLMYIEDEFIVDEIVRFENLEEDIFKLLDKLELPSPKRELGEYKKNKRRPDKDWKKMYSNETKELVEKHFKFYMDLFNYSF
jgi:hypothetical protein